MSLLDRLIASIAPYDCLSCGKEGALLCFMCANLFNTLPERCYRCRKLSANFTTCHSCRHASNIRQLNVYTDYDFIAKQLIQRLKYSGAQSVSKIAVDLMASILTARQEAVLVPVPTASSRARQRGYDQAKLLAKQLANRTSTTYSDCLARSGNARQVGASRRLRMSQLKSAFRVKQRYTVKDRHFILIDDVLTTGATLEAAAKCLKSAGAKRIDAIVFAQA